MDFLPASDRHAWTAVNCYAAGDFAGAIAACDDALHINPNHAHAYNTRGAARYNLGDLTGALADCDRALALQPVLVGALFNRAAVRTALNDYAGAVADCDQALALNPGKAGVYHCRAVARYGLHDFHGSIADCDRALALDPRLAPAYAARAAALNGLGLCRQAIPDCDRALALDPRLVLGYVARANARYHCGLAAATLDFRRAFAINPAVSAKLVVSGLVSAARQEPCVTLEQCNNHLLKNPDDAIHYARRGVIQMLRGDEVAAERDLAHYLSLRPEGKGNLELLVAEARRRLAAV
ncbi:tetratricopeptide repeat protein [Gemmata sp.]|uniref:tetratricopeptide repeat protein n=1 Tax=Gemmata sp. TaxID=1914242 RepID=UPI003F7125EF